MVKAGYDGVGVDILPLVSATEQGMALVLPGSAIKGALRSQAERIVRTVLDRRAAPLVNARQRFLKHLEELPLICEIFGSRAQTPEALSATPVPATGPLPGLGALAVDDCYARNPMPPEHWRAVTIARAAPEQSYEDQELWQTLNILERVSQGREHYTVAHHVAIDRWTGGAADGMLFSVLEPVHTAWHDLRLVLDLGRLPETLCLPGLMLLLLTLRDLLQNRLPLGFATNRGMGELVVSEIHFQGTALDTLDLGIFTDFRLSEGGFGALDAPMRERLTTSWQAWIATQAAGALQ
jgi:CRISPR/Cas system CSM-associated protein Csm3 (group 7 of RAMP superfamily)